MSYGRELVRKWLFEYACRHYMPAALHEIALHHNSVWTEELWSIPPVFPMIAVVRDVVARRDEEKYSYVLDIVTELYERTMSFVEYSIYAKLSVALKILVLFRMLRNLNKMVLPCLNAYFPRSGLHDPNADKDTEKHLNHGQLEFRKFFLRLIANEPARKVYMETEFEKEYGDTFMLRLTELVRRFVNAIETMLPQPVIDTILTSAPDSALVRELASSHSPSFELLLDATEGRDSLTEVQVLEVLQNLRIGNSSVQTDRFVGLGIDLLISPVDQAANSMLKNGDLSKKGITRIKGKKRNKGKKRKADEKYESTNCSLETGECGRASNFLQPRKKTRFSNGGNDLVEEDESSLASEGQKDRVAKLRCTGCTCKNSTAPRDCVDNRCLKSTVSQNDEQYSGDISCSKPTDENSDGLSKSEESPNCKRLGGEGNVNFGSNDLTNYCLARPSSSDTLSSSRHYPATLRCPVTVDQHVQPSVTAFGIQDRTNGTDCKQSNKTCSVRGQEDGLGDEKDVEPTVASKGDSNHNCSPLSLESGKEHAISSESPVREDAIPDTPPYQQGISSLHKVTVEGCGEEEVVDEQSYITDSEDLQSCATTREEIVPSSYSFDKFDLVVRDVSPMVPLPPLQKHAHSSSHCCVVKLRVKPDSNYTAISGKKLMIYS